MGITQVVAGSSGQSTLGTQSNPATSASAILAARPGAPDGVYWFQIPTGSNTLFSTYCIMTRDGGGWMKAVQYNSGTVVTGSAAINTNGTWVNAEINTAPGKLATSDIARITGSSFLLRVTGGSDTLFNAGTGTGKLIYSTTLPTFGTDLDPTLNYNWLLDMTSDGSYEYNCLYTNDTRGRCSAATDSWIDDHNYNATFQGAIPPAAPGGAICWTFGPSSLITNLHWMSGTPTQSAGAVPWGDGSTTAAAIYLKA